MAKLICCEAYHVYGHETSHSNVQFFTEFFIASNPSCYEKLFL